jgi:hypothetical protein
LNTSSRDHEQSTGSALDLKNLLPGDGVLISVEFVKIDAFGCPIVRVKGANKGEYLYTEGSIAASTIVAHTPRAVAVGDRVKNARCAAFPPAYTGGVVMAIADGWAMVQFEKTPGCVPVADLERVS